MWVESIYHNEVSDDFEAREKIFRELFNPYELNVQWELALYNFCMENDHFLSIADYLLADKKNLENNELLWLIIPQFMKELKSSDIFDDTSIYYVRSKLMEELIKHQIKKPTKDTVVKLVFTNWKIKQEK